MFSFQGAFRVPQKKLNEVMIPHCFSQFLFKKWWAKMDSKGGSWQQSGGLLQPPWLFRRKASPWPTTSKKTQYGGLAQLGERLPCKQEVSGSIPLISTKKLTEATRNCCFIEFLEKEIQRCTLKTEHC